MACVNQENETLTQYYKAFFARHATLIEAPKQPKCASHSDVVAEISWMRIRPRASKVRDTMEGGTPFPFRNAIDLADSFSTSGVNSVSLLTFQDDESSSHNGHSIRMSAFSSTVTSSTVYMCSSFDSFEVFEDEVSVNGEVHSVSCYTQTTSGTSGRGCSTDSKSPGCHSRFARMAWQEEVIQQMLEIEEDETTPQPLCSSLLLNGSASSVYFAMEEERTRMSWNQAARFSLYETSIGGDTDEITPDDMPPLTSIILETSDLNDSSLEIDPALVPLVAKGTPDASVGADQPGKFSSGSENKNANSLLLLSGKKLETVEIIPDNAASDHCMGFRTSKYGSWTSNSSKSFRRPRNNKKECIKSNLNRHIKEATSLTGSGHLGPPFRTYKSSPILCGPLPALSVATDARRARQDDRSGSNRQTRARKVSYGRRS